MHPSQLNWLQEIHLPQFPCCRLTCKATAIKVGC